MAGRRKAKPQIQCIYCSETKPPSKEHVIPRTLGTYRGLDTLTRHSCLDCNGRLSALDEIFARTGPEALFRHIAGVTGRAHHRPVNPFYFRLDDQGGVQAKGKHPDYPFEVLWELQPGQGLQGGEARQVVFKVGKHYEAPRCPRRASRTSWRSRSGGGTSAAPT